MARTWTPAQEAAMALDGKTLLVSAAAGSGKTSVLTERIIRSLTRKESPADLSRMLIVTFTRAAAAELKGRIASALTDALAEDPSNRHLSNQLLALGGAQISTIDSFFQRIVRANFDHLGLAATFRIADESEALPLAIDVLDGVIEEYYEKYNTLRGQSGSAIAALADNAFAKALDNVMSDRSDGTLSFTLLGYMEQFASYPEGIDLLAASAAELDAITPESFLASSYGRAIVRYLYPSFALYADRLAKLNGEIGENSAVYAKCANLLDSDLTFCRAMVRDLDGGNYATAQQTAASFIKGRFPTIKDKPDAVARYQILRKRLTKTVARAQQILSLPPHELERQLRATADFCRILHDFYKTFQARFLAEKQSRGMLEYNDVRAMLYRLLNSPDGSPSQIALELAEHYDAVYIDEYQDVDLLQDRIFATVGGNRRFMVGDIKQSIYGFRGSDPSIFAAYRRALPLHTDPVQSPDGVCVFMSENFRCDRPVIDFANQVCAFLFSACEESVGYREEDDLVCSKSQDGITPSPAQVAVFEKGDGETDPEAVWVAAEISRLLRTEKKNDGTPLSPSDIAILVRTRNAGNAFADALTALNIPVVTEREDAMLSDPLLIDTLNLLRAIDNPYRDIPLSELLLSPMGGYMLEELSIVREASPRDRALFDAMQDAPNAEIPDALKQKIQHTLKKLENLRDMAAVQPADRFLRLLYLDECLVDHAGEAPLLFLYEQARLYQRTSWCGLYGFLSHLDRLLERGNLSAQGFAKAEDAVAIMTIHHSKGLEFPAVFVTACDTPFNRADLTANLFYHRRVGAASKLYLDDLGEHESTALCEAVKLEIAADQAEEAIRTLYVALTRARERLYVTGTLRAKSENALAHAAEITYGDRAAILDCSNYLTWILAALEQPPRKNAVHTPQFKIFGADEVTEGEVFSHATATAEETAQTERITDAERYAAVRRRAADFAYPLAALQGLPTKAAASKLRPDLLDDFLAEDNDDEALEKQIELMQNAASDFDAILSDIQKPKATDIGTATHAFLQFCDFARLAEVGIDEECARLVSLGFISESAAKIINRRQLEALCKSDLMALIQNATNLRREQKFGLSLPLSTLTQSQALANALGDAAIFVQGSIDLLLTMPDGSLILVDYKTDRITDAERANEGLLKQNMQQKHGHQIDCYAEAVRTLFGKAPDQRYIYSMPLGRMVGM